MLLLSYLGRVLRAARLQDWLQGKVTVGWSPRYTGSDGHVGIGNEGCREDAGGRRHRVPEERRERSGAGGPRGARGRAARRALAASGRRGRGSARGTCLP